MPSKMNSLSTGMSHGAIFLLGFLSPSIPVVWHGESTVGNWMYGYPVIDGLQCNLVKIRFHKMDIVQICVSAPLAPIV